MELVDLMEEIDSLWLKVLWLHHREYTQEVTQLLNEAYQLILPSLGEP